MKCPNCSGYNPDGAEWCGQCFIKFGQEPVAQAVPLSPKAPPAPAAPATTRPTAPAKAPTAEPLAEPAGQVPPQSSAPSTTKPAPRSFDISQLQDHPVVSDRGFMRRGKQLVGWKCPECQKSNTMDSYVCPACGTNFFDSLGATEPQKESPPKQPQLAAYLSVIPGAGHLYLGKIGDGLARLLLALWWFGAAIWLFAATIVPLGFLYLVAGGLLMAVSIFDSYRQAKDPDASPLLRREAMMYSTLILVGISVLAAVLAILSARN